MAFGRSVGRHDSSLMTFLLMLPSTALGDGKSTEAKRRSSKPASANIKLQAGLRPPPQLDGLVARTARSHRAGDCAGRLKAVMQHQGIARIKAHCRTCGTTKQKRLFVFNVWTRLVELKADGVIRCNRPTCRRNSNLYGSA